MSTAGEQADITRREGVLATEEEVGIGDQILDLIRERGLRPGDRLPTEFELSKTFGISRQKVREGLLDLESIGLIRSRQGSGRVLLDRGSYTLPALLSRGVEHSPQDLLDAVIVRQVLEVGFVRSAVPLLSDESKQRMHAALQDMRAKQEAGEPFPEADRRFHDALYEGLHNQLLNRLLDNFWNLFLGIDLDVLRHREGADETVAHHAHILAAAEAGDADVAQAHMQMHFYDSVQSLRDFVADTAERQQPPAPAG